jgi:dTDP-4-amino-4,6-dideoxygalactose transaminase
VLRSGRVSQWTGEEVAAFEREFAEFAGTRYAVAVANGTVALELALLALGIGPGDEVVVTPRSFFASVSAIVLRGARPVFADVDRDSQNITRDSVAAVLTPRTRAVVCVHLAGWPCEMDPILELARERGLAVVEDCAQAHGARYRGRPVGSLGDIAAWSFCQDKIMTTGGEGGMVTTDRPDLWERAWSFKDHGKSWQAVYGRTHPPGFRWLHESFGTNWRMTEIQAAIGRVQLRKVADWVRLRRRNATIFHETLGGLDAVRSPVPPPHIGHGYYRYYAFVRPERLKPGWSRDRILGALLESGIPTGVGACPEIYRELAVREAGLAPPAPLPVAKELGETSLAFLVHPTLNEETVRTWAETAAGIIRDASV